LSPILGATLKFQAGTVKRAPPLMRQLGFEWLWRIKEEPYLWRRYWSDGLRLCWLVMTCVVPLGLSNLIARSTASSAGFAISRHEGPDAVIVKLSGSAIGRHIDAAITCFQEVLELGKPILIDFLDVGAIDPRFFGLLLMLRKWALARGFALQLVNLRSRIKKRFRQNGFEFLLST
jgi:N-acetylglucosaminyldiphosphoundecaprenol N-acetyl-beta-D-mannosaminyltransferase